MLDRDILPPPCHTPDHSVRLNMSVRLYAGDVDDLTGAVFASWFIFSPNGPTAFAVGFAETAHMLWSFFYRRMHFAGAKTYWGLRSIPKSRQLPAIS